MLKKVLDKQVSLVKAAEELSLSYSQIKRLHKPLQEEGSKGLVFGLPGPNRLDKAVKAKALSRLWGPTRK